MENKLELAIEQKAQLNELIRTLFVNCISIKWGDDDVLDIEGKGWKTMYRIHWLELCQDLIAKMLYVRLERIFLDTLEEYHDWKRNIFNRKNHPVDALYKELDELKIWEH